MQLVKVTTANDCKVPRYLDIFGFYHSHHMPNARRIAQVPKFTYHLIIARFVNKHTHGQYYYYNIIVGQGEQVQYMSIYESDNENFYDVRTINSSSCSKADLCFLGRSSTEIRSTIVVL